MMSFIHLWVLVALIPLYLMYKKHLKEVRETPLVDDTSMGVRQTKLLYLSLFFMIVALSRPVIEESRVDEKFDAQEFIIAIDASFSMQAEDLVPTRYVVAKKAISKLIKMRPKDRFSIFAFTSNALLVSPPTTDTAISMMALDALEPKNILTKSTNLKSLLQTIAKSSFVQKKLIIFTDGGDEHNVKMLADICKKNNIVLYVVATGSASGASLKKDGKLIRDQYGSLVISRINPILKDLATMTDGAYFTLESNDLAVIDDLSNALDTQKGEEAIVSVKSYRELFYVPLFIAAVLFLLGITNLHQRYFLLFLLMLLPYEKVEAKVLDFYYLDKAKEQYTASQYKAAASTFKKVEASTKSYYNIGVSYYKMGDYKRAMEYFGQIETGDRELKRQIFYNMGNCAVRLERYDRAMKYYQQALTLGEDSDASYNLHLLQKLKLVNKTNVSDMLPQRDGKSKKNSSKKNDTTQDEKQEGSSRSNSNRTAEQSSAGAGSSKKGKSKKAKESDNKANSKSEYKVGYKLYELINKGYTDEKEPW